jgi:hypothetical protein
MRPWVSKQGIYPGFQLVVLLIVIAVIVLAAIY